MTLNKEDRNQYILHFPSWLARFIYNLQLTPQGLLCKPGGGNIFIWYGSFLPHWAAICINIMLIWDDEPEIVYGTAF